MTPSASGIQGQAMKSFALIAVLCVSSGAWATDSLDIHRVNGAIVLAAGETVGNVSTVNGSIRADDRAVLGTARTTNGSIHLGQSASADSLKTVNGAIVIGPDVRVAGTVRTVNGAIKLGQAAEVSGYLINVNGRISLDSAHVADGIETVSGDIDVGHDSRVEGGILVRRSRGASSFDAVVLQWLGFRDHEPTIVIGPNAVVQGPLRFEREVKLYVSAQAHVGPVEGAHAIPYSGAHPPTLGLEAP
jgi:DUF4097 and DUF4098 domain-containing protein YvlB